jgi:hypothetical protein
MNVLVVAFGTAPRRWPAMNLLFSKILCAELSFEIYLMRQSLTAYKLSKCSCLFWFSLYWALPYWVYMYCTLYISRAVI